MNRIQNKSHNIGTYRITKIYFSCYSGKKYIPENGYLRLSHFHKSC